jgi:hypothetical protein
LSRISREVFEAIERRQKAGTCEVCGALLVQQTAKPFARKYCPNKDDGRHSHPGGKKIRVKAK